MAVAHEHCAPTLNTNLNSNLKTYYRVWQQTCVPMFCSAAHSVYSCVLKCDRVSLESSFKRESEREKKLSDREKKKGWDWETLEQGSTQPGCSSRENQEIPEISGSEKKEKEQCTHSICLKILSFTWSKNSHLSASNRVTFSHVY